MPSRISALVDLVVLLVGQQDHHDVAARGGVGDVERPRARRPWPARPTRVLAQADDDVDARVLEVLRVGVALGAVAEDRHGLAVQQVEVRVVVVVHGAPT